MTIVRHTKKSKPTFTPEQIERFERLAQLDDSEIDYSDIPATTAEDWKNATLFRDRHQLRRINDNQSNAKQNNNEKSPVLDEDVNTWLSKQSSSTKSRVNDLIRIFMREQESQMVH